MIKIKWAVIATDLIKLVFVTIMGLYAFGFILNIVELFKLDFKAPYKAEVIRILAIPTSLGGIVGWININD